MNPRVFTIPPSVPFLPALIGALRDGRLVAALSASVGMRRQHWRRSIDLDRVAMVLPIRLCEILRIIIAHIHDLGSEFPQRTW
jgi:hypothetical protein